MAQELISHKILSLDFWRDTVTYAGSVMPTGTIGCAVLNIPDETITRLDAPCIILNQLLTGIGLKNTADGFRIHGFLQNKRSECVSLRKVLPMELVRTPSK